MLHKHKAVCMCVSVNHVHVCMYESSESDLYSTPSLNKNSIYILSYVNIEIVKTIQFLLYKIIFHFSPIALTQNRCFSVVTAFVRLSAVIFSVGMCVTLTVEFPTLSRRKWCRMSMCLVLAR